MTATDHSLDLVPQDVKQFCLNCISGSFGVDRRDAVDGLGLRTFNSVPMLGWDLAFTNLLAAYPGAICTKNKSGCWEYILLYDQASDFVFSFMRESRFKAIRKMAAHKRPIYVSALLSFTNSVTAPLQQKELFACDDISAQRRQAIAERLLAICAQFQCEGVSEIKNHAFVVFSQTEGQISSFKVYVLNTAMEVVHKEDWLPSLTPDITPMVEDIAESARVAKPMKLTEKAKKRLQKSELVKPKPIEGQEIVE